MCKQLKTSLTVLYLLYLYRFTDLNELQAQVEATIFESGNTMTAMAMRKALEFYKEEQRDSTDTARVREKEEK